MKSSAQIKTHAADIRLDLVDHRGTMVTTRNGETTAVLQNIASSAQTEDALTLLKLLELGNQDIEAGRTKPARDVVKRLKVKAFTD